MDTLPPKNTSNTHTYESNLSGFDKLLDKGSLAKILTSSSKSPLVENEMETQSVGEWPAGDTAKTRTAAGWNLVPTAVKVVANLNFMDTMRSKLRG